MEVMINDVVLSYSPTDEETRYKQGENGTVQSAMSRKQHDL